MPRFCEEEGGTAAAAAACGNDRYPSPLHRIHVRSVLSDSEVERCRRLAHGHAAATGCWDRPDHARHASYPTCDFAVPECAALAAYLNDEIGLDGRVLGHLTDLFGIAREDMSYLDFFCAHYQVSSDDADDEADAAVQTMDRLEAHRDGSLLSFTITLTSPGDFEGGGTFFDALRDAKPTDVLRPGGVVRPCRAGDGVFHSGKLLHGADVVRSGERTVLVGFVEVADRCQRPGALFSACRDWGRMDVARYRYKRQQAMTNHGEKKGWFLKNSRWLPQGEGRGHVQGFCPAFPSVRRRAESASQRRKKLEAEDRLLRSILLSDEEKDQVEHLEFSVL